jgi:hypothetical protein
VASVILYGNEPDFPVTGVGTCATCKRAEVELRTANNGVRVCADLSRCAMAIAGVPDEVLRAEMPPGEIWLIEAP